MRNKILVVTLAISILAVGPTWAAIEILRVSKPIPNTECQTATGWMITEGIEIQLLRAGDVYSLTIPAWNPETFQPWTKPELLSYLAANKDSFSLKPVPAPEYSLFDGVKMTDRTMDKWITALIDELNTLRQRAGLAPRTKEDIEASISR
jgi:hypothetical protein